MRHAFSRRAWYSIGTGIASKRLLATALATAFSSRTINDRKDNHNQGNRMTSRLEPYRVQAFNTAKLSENKMHDDTVAKRFGFSGGLVPGVDVMAYMMQLPVTKWGRAVLAQGLVVAVLG